VSTQPADTNPYIGPHPFRPDQGHLFFGREREAGELVSLVIANRVVLFFAQSGAGKSSLINARLVPELLRKKFEVLPVGRVSGDRSANLAVPNIFIFNLMAYLDQGERGEPPFAQEALADFLVNLNNVDGRWIHAEAGSAPPLPTDLPALALPAGEAATLVEDLEIRPRILIVDQFEEILTAYSEAWEQRADFFKQIRQALDMDPYLWVLFAMREDFVAALSPYTHLLADGLRTRYYMQPMDEEAALAAITQPAALYGHVFEPGVARLLVKNLRQIDDAQSPPGSVDSGGVASKGAGGRLLGQFVEPVQLQVVCRQLWDSLTTPPGAPITMEDLENLAGGAGPEEFVNDALRVYYEQSLTFALSEASPGISERILRNWFDQVVITKEGKRNLVHQSALESGGMPNVVVKVLVDRFILRRETRGDRGWVELGHDRFIEPIRRANRQWFASERSPTALRAEVWVNAHKDPALLFAGAQLAEVAAQVEAHPEEFLPLEQEFIKTSRAVELKNAERRRRTVLTALTVSVVALLGVLAIMGYLLVSERNSRQSAELANRSEVAASRNARMAQATAEAAGATAVAARATAVAAQATAEAARALALVGERTALADGLAVKALNLLEQEPQLALLLAANAAALQTGHAEAVAPAVEQALHRILGATGGRVIPIAGGVPYAVALSNDERWLAAGAEPGVVRVWDLANPAVPPLALPGHAGVVSALQFTADDGTLISVDDVGVARLWDLAAATPQAAVLNTDGEAIFAVALLTDTLASVGPTAGADSRVRIRDLAQEGKLVREWENPAQSARFAVFSPDGRFLTTAGNDGSDGSVRFWDLTASAPTSRTITTTGVQVLGVAAAPAGARFAVGRSDGTITVYDLRRGAATTTARGPVATLTDVAFMRGGTGAQLAATDAGGTIWVWDDANLAREPMELRGHAGPIQQLAAGSHAIMATVGDDGTARVWDRLSPTYEPANLLTVTGSIKHMALSPSSAALVTVNDADRVAQLWERTGDQSFRAVGAGMALSVTAAAYGGQDELLLLGAEDGALSAWNPPAGAPLWTVPGHGQRINAIAVDPKTGQAATVGDDGAVRLWELGRGKQLASLPQPSALPLVDVAFSPDGALIAAAGVDGRVHLWERDGGQPLPPQPAMEGASFTSLAFNADGSELAAAQDDGTIWRWQTAGFQPLPAPVPGAPVRALVYDQRHLITAHDDGAIYLWNLDDMAGQAVRLAGHTAGVTDLIVQGQDYLLSAAEDGIVRRWGLTVPALAELACRGAGRSILPAEARAYLPQQAPADACPQIATGTP